MIGKRRAGKTLRRHEHEPVEKAPGDTDGGGGSGSAQPEVPDRLRSVEIEHVGGGVGRSAGPPSGPRGRSRPALRAATAESGGAAATTRRARSRRSRTE